tara:strand:+ start:109 stop:270 length:162 start_codon:yes stop_codon:yes gene_type:complete
MVGHTIEKNVKHAYAMDQSMEYLNGSKGDMLKKTLVKSADFKVSTLSNLMYIT